MINGRSRPEREAYVEGLFSCIASRYDLLNTVISFSRHRAWRRFAVSRTGLQPGGCALDVCCGTGDFAFELARKTGPEGRVIGVDFSMPMLELAVRKGRRTGCGWVSFLAANACRLPFADESFDCVTVGFGLRNVADLRAAVSEMVRVARPGGKVVSLEISGVRSRVLSLPWAFYFDVLMPRLAGLFRGKREAYRYLRDSVKGFESPEGLAAMFEDCGLCGVRVYSLAFGAVRVHVGARPG